MDWCKFAMPLHNFKESAIQKTKTFRKPKKFESLRIFTLYKFKVHIHQIF